MKATQEKLEGWKEVEEEREEDSVYLKWETEGTELTGKLVEMFESKTEAWYGKIDTGQKLLTMFSMPAVLKGKLKGLEGQEVRIVFIGQIKFRSGKTGKDFKVLVKGGGNPPSQLRRVESFVDRGDTL